LQKVLTFREQKGVKGLSYAKDKKKNDAVNSLVQGTEVLMLKEWDAGASHIWGWERQSTPDTYLGSNWYLESIGYLSSFAQDMSSRIAFIL